MALDRYVNHCWNCGENVDSRDSDNPQCNECTSYKCSKCGACHIEGCLTNPYSKHNRLKNNTNKNSEKEDEYFWELDWEEHCQTETCDWCGVRPVTYRDAAYSLCEICENQLWGD